MNETDVILKFLPESVKHAVSNYQMHKVASRLTGIDEFTLDKIAEYFGGRMAAQKMRWRPVVDGLIALHNLRK